MGSLAARLWQWFGAWMVRGGASAGKNVAVGAGRQVGAYLNQGVQWLRGTRIYRQTRVAYVKTKRAIMADPRKATKVSAAIGFNVALLYYFDELIAAGKNLLGDDDLQKGDSVLAEIRNGPLYQQFAAELARELMNEGVKEDQIVSSLKTAEELVRAQQPIFAQLQSRSPTGTTPLQLLMAYALLAPAAFSESLGSLTEDQVGPGTAAILSALSSLGAQLEMFNPEGDSMTGTGSTTQIDSTLSSAVGPVTVIGSNSNQLTVPTASYLQKVTDGGASGGCVNDLARLTGMVTKLENLLGVSGRSMSGEPNLAILLTLLGNITADDVRRVYEVRSAVTR